MKILKLVFLLLVISIISVLLLGNIDGNPDVGLIRGPYKVLPDGNPDDLHFKLTYVGDFGCEITVKADCVDGYDVQSPPIGSICMLEGTQKFICGNGKYQDLRWTETESMTCEAFVPLNWKNPLPPPCCTTCKACFTKVDMANGNKVLQNLGCLDYTDVSRGQTPKILSTVSLSSGQGIKMVTSCEDGSCPDLTVYENGKLVTNDKFKDCNGITGCKDIGFATNVVPIDYFYWERGCKCQVKAKAIDP